MSGTALAIAAAYAAFGIGLASIPFRRAGVVLALMIVSVLLTAIFAPAPVMEGQALLLLSGSIVIAAALAIFSNHTPAPLWFAVATMVGASIGAAGSASPPLSILAPMPLALLFLLARFLSARPRRLAINILLSWLIAIGLISGAFAFVPRSGPAGDHAL